ATTVVLSGLGLVLGPTLVAMFAALGVGVGPAVPLGLSLICALLFGILPYLALKQEAGVRRRDFRHAVGSFLDLVSMNLAGGRGGRRRLAVRPDPGHPGVRPAAGADAVGRARPAGRGAEDRRVAGPVGRADPGGRRRRQGAAVAGGPCRHAAAPRAVRDRGQG